MKERCVCGGVDVFGQQLKLKPCGSEWLSVDSNVTDLYKRDLQLIQSEDEYFLRVFTLKGLKFINRIQLKLISSISIEQKSNSFPQLYKIFLENTIV